MLHVRRVQHGVAGFLGLGNLLARDSERDGSSEPLHARGPDAAAAGRLRTLRGFGGKVGAPDRASDKGEWRESRSFVQLYRRSTWRV